MQHSVVELGPRVVGNERRTAACFGDAGKIGNHALRPLPGLRVCFALEQPLIRPQCAARKAHALVRPCLPFENLHERTQGSRVQPFERRGQIAAIELVVTGDEHRGFAELPRPGHRLLGSAKIASDNDQIRVGLRWVEGMHRKMQIGQEMDVHVSRQ